MIPEQEIARLTDEVTALRTAIDTLANVPDALPPLLERLEHHEQRLHVLREALRGSTAGETFLGDKVLGDKVVNVQVGDQLPDEVLLREYLGDLSRACRQLSLADVESGNPSRSALDLASVYTLLEVGSVALTDTARLRTLSGEPRQLTVLEALDRASRLVLLGDPGSGKSSAVNFIGLCLAQTLLGQLGWLERLEGWTYGPLLPIRVLLGEFGAWVEHDVTGREGVGLLWDFLASRYGAALASVLRRELAAGRVLLLLDGLDEIRVGRPNNSLRRVVSCLEALGESAGLSRILVTCRIADYEQPRRRLAGWPSETLIPLSEKLRIVFIRHWYQALIGLGRPMNGEPEILRARLEAQVRGRPELRRLASSPLLLTMMTLLHTYEGRLPEERVRLYDKTVSFLLHVWRANPDAPPLRTLLSLPDWSESDTARLLDRLGYAAHERGASEGEEGTDLPRTTLVETARTFFMPYNPDQDFSLAQTFANYLSSAGNGLLRQHGPEIYRFSHRTFQEFLAARRLVADDWEGADVEFVDRALRRIEAGPHWREPLLLAVSQQVSVAGQVRPAAQLAEELLVRSQKGSVDAARDAMLAAEVLAEIGRERLLRLGSRRAALWQRVALALVRLLGSLSPAGRPLLPVGERVRAGHALGLLGDLRLPITAEQWTTTNVRQPEGRVWRRNPFMPQALLEAYWCDVPEGPFLLGSTPVSRDAPDWEQPQRTVELAAFRIARYPVTNAQWRAFVDDGGYNERRWWDAAGWVERHRENWEQPDDWDDLRFSGSNQPVTGVSWYEANAFCRWLSARAGFVVRLPSEAEWEKASRGADGRRFPWGRNRIVARANTSESGFGATTPVGCYLDGASPYGALDMVGNVWEWTASPWRGDYVDSDGTGRARTYDESLVIRGGVWASPLTQARCAARDGFAPDGRAQILGLRLAANL